MSAGTKRKTYASLTDGAARAYVYTANELVPIDSEAAVKCIECFNAIEVACACSLNNQFAVGLPLRLIGAEVSGPPVAYLVCDVCHGDGVCALSNVQFAELPPVMCIVCRALRGEKRQKKIEESAAWQCLAPQEKPARPADEKARTKASVLEKAARRAPAPQASPAVRQHEEAAAWQCLAEILTEQETTAKDYFKLPREVATPNDEQLRTWKEKAKEKKFPGRGLAFYRFAFKQAKKNHADAIARAKASDSKETPESTESASAEESPASPVVPESAKSNTAPSLSDSTVTLVQTVSSTD